MADNSKKTPFYRTMGDFVQNKAVDFMQLEGKALPAEVVSVVGSIVTVKFLINSSFTLPTVPMPLFGPVYIRYPIQVGDLGVVLPMDVYIGGVSGLGGGVANLSQRANLGALVFLPIANTDWSTVDPNAVTVNGPNGVVLRDTGSGCVFTLTPTQIIIEAAETYQVTVGDSVFQMTNAQTTLTSPIFNVDCPVINLNGAVAQTAGSAGGAVSLIGPVTVVNELTANGVGVATHTHGGIVRGGGNTDSPNNPS